jgi:hypothetical protein
LVGEESHQKSGRNEQLVLALPMLMQRKHQKKYQKL